MLFLRILCQVLLNSEDKYGNVTFVDIKYTCFYSSNLACYKKVFSNTFANQIKELDVEKFDTDDKNYQSRIHGLNAHLISKRSLRSHKFLLVKKDLNSFVHSSQTKGL